MHIVEITVILCVDPIVFFLLIHLIILQIEIVYGVAASSGLESHQKLTRLGIQTLAVCMIIGAAKGRSDHAVYAKLVEQLSVMFIAHDGDIYRRPKVASKKHVRCDAEIMNRIKISVSGDDGFVADDVCDELLTVWTDVNLLVIFQTSLQPPRDNLLHIV